MREECRPRVSENRVLRKIFGLQRDDITRKWRKLHKEELGDLYSKYCLGDQIEENEMGGACSTYGGDERCIQGFHGET
jgi:hypothetical protein